MNIILTLNKPLSKTPNQMIEVIRSKFPHFAKEKIGFAGRLDPMARGLLLLLVGDANFEREKYLNLDKTYEFTAILGLETDSYDLLGILENESAKHIPKNYQEIVDQFIEKSKGKKSQPYPPFSTKPVQGKELFKWAREGRISEIEIPEKEITIFSCKRIAQSTISATELHALIIERIEKVEGFFRQDEILKKWHDFFQKNTESDFITLSFEIRCTSGTYVRSLVHNLGKQLGSGAVTLDIYRTKVGTYSIEKALDVSL